MTASVVAVVAATLQVHGLGVREWSDGYRYTSCMCPEEVGATGHSAHVAAAVVEALGLTEETRKRLGSGVILSADAEGWDMYAEDQHRFVSPWVAVDGSNP